MRLLVCLVCVILALGCGEANAPVMQPSLPREKFIPLLADVRVLEGVYATQLRTYANRPGLLDSQYTAVFSKHGVSREQFTQSFTAYASDAESMVAIEDSVMAILSRMQAETGESLPEGLGNYPIQRPSGDQP